MFYIPLCFYFSLDFTRIRLISSFPSFSFSSSFITFSTLRFLVSDTFGITHVLLTPDHASLPHSLNPLSSVTLPHPHSPIYPSRYPSHLRLHHVCFHDGTIPLHGFNPSSTTRQLIVIVTTADITHVSFHPRPTLLYSSTHVYSHQVHRPTPACLLDPLNVSTIQVYH